VETKEARKELRAVLDYLEDEERKDYEANPGPDHIYLSVCFLRGYLNASTPKREEA
jgi:hypothetical protein